MPDHPHLVGPLADPAAARVRLNRLLGQLARKLGIGFLGEAAEPTLIASPQKLLRDLRYVALNPPRAGLVDDPLAWWFSTHRDVIGAIIDPWVDARRLAAALGRRTAGFASWYHRYVSADPSVRVDGTPMPRAALPTAITRVPLARIGRAVAAATRARPEAIRSKGVHRDLFVALAREQGWRSTSALASACACSTRAIQRSATRDVDLDPARLCLGDHRLLRGVPKWRASSQRDPA
jgi:hypothetical protein